jgi:hypothetical protein
MITPHSFFAASGAVEAGTLRSKERTAAACALRRRPGEYSRLPDVPLMFAAD